MRPSCGTWPTAARPRAVWGAAPATDWPDLLARAAAATYASGRGALICVPDGKDVGRVDRALARVLGEGHHVALTADAGPARRYADFLAVSRGVRRVVVGTRAAAFAPVRDLGLVAIWDDGDDLHAEPRAPYPHTRETLLLRAEREQAAALVGGFARTVEAEYLVRSGWAAGLTAPRAVLRERATVAVAGAADRDLERDVHARGARIPTQVHDTVRDALRTGPVLVQTPRTGYAASLACERCRTPARCTTCAGPLALTSADRAAVLPLVRHPGAGLGLPGVRPPRAARAGARRRPHRRGARPQLRQHAACAPPAGPAWWPRSTTGPRSWWPRRGPSRSPPGATPPWCCSTPGCCWAAPTCAPPRRRCAAGATRPGWSAREAG